MLFIAQIVVIFIYNNRYKGRNNISGIKVAELRKAMGISQRQLADKLQLIELDIDKNAIQRIESGQRFVTDIELKAISKVFNVPISELLTISEQSKGEL